MSGDVLDEPSAPVDVHNVLARAIADPENMDEDAVRAAAQDIIIATKNIDPQFRSILQPEDIQGIHATLQA